MYTVVQLYNNNGIYTILSTDCEEIKTFLLGLEVIVDKGNC